MIFSHSAVCWRMPWWTCLYLNYLLLAGGVLFQAFRLGYVCLRRLCLGLVSGAAVYISLFWPSRAPSLDFLFFLRPIGQTGRLWLGYCAWKSVFSSILLGFASRSVMFIAKLYFWILWLFQALCLSLDRLIGPTLVHGSGHGKGHPKLSWAGFWCSA